MKYEAGKISLHYTDFLKVLFLPIWLIWLGHRLIVRPLDSCPYHHDPIYITLAVLYWIGVTVGGVWFTLESTTCHREIAEVQEVARFIQPKDAKTGEVRKDAEPVRFLEAVVLTLEEHPKLFNADQVKHFKFCRFENTKEWFQINDDGSFTTLGVGDPNELATWEVNRTNYLEYLWHAHCSKVQAEKKRKIIDQKLKEVQEKLNKPEGENF